MCAQFLILDRQTKECLYEAGSIAQAMGFADAQSEPCLLASIHTTYSQRAEWLYRIALVDGETGQIIADGPVVSLLDADALELVDRARVLLIPANTKGVQHV